MSEDTSSSNMGGLIEKSDYEVSCTQYNLVEELTAQMREDLHCTNRSECSC